MHSASSFPLYPYIYDYKYYLKIISFYIHASALPHVWHINNVGKKSDHLQRRRLVQD